MRHNNQTFNSDHANAFALFIETLFKSPTHTPLDFDTNDIGDDEIIAHVQSIYKAIYTLRLVGPGPDQIPAILIKKMKSARSPFINYLINHSKLDTFLRNGNYRELRLYIKVGIVISLPTTNLFVHSTFSQKYLKQ